MRLWDWLLRRADEPAAAADEEELEADGTIPLPTEPYVFECRECGKVFEIRRLRTTCPECDSPNVELMSG
jgi:Zn finger protein HypA/HybF involved in hydrogenase expression